MFFAYYSGIGGTMTNRFEKQYNGKGFTLIEIVVAAAVFSLFSIGVFSFYRMGSNMFVKGSWKLEKQKEAERFLTIVKDRIEQASNAATVDAKQVKTVETRFATLASGTVINLSSSITSLTRLMMFCICKPDISKLYPNKKGLILYNSLAIVPNAKKLYTLYFGSRTTKAAISGIDLFNTSLTIGPQTALTGDFTATPKFYSLGNDPFLIKLTDVSSVRMTWGVASNTKMTTSQAANVSGTEIPKIVGLEVKMQNPKYPSTNITQRFRAKIDYTVKLTSCPTGGI